LSAPLVTTILPVYNRPAMLREAVASVLAQTHRPIEIVIVDDGSTDDTPSVADSFGASVRVIHQPNRGPGAAREAGRLAARGDYIQYLDSDDLLDPRKFELQVAALERDHECDVAYGWTRARFSGAPWKRTGERIATMFPSMLESRWWDTSTPLYRRSIVERAGPWSDLRREEDWEYDCRVAAMGVRLSYCEAWVSETRFHDEAQLSATRDANTLREQARAHALILGHAQRAAISPATPEMQHFARELFLLARQCGAAGLARESRELFALARDASGAERNRAQFRIYAAVARTIGWTNAGKLSRAIDAARGVILSRRSPEGT
jgi:glycosyltransferase involved in cell wall biosynthesis